MALTKKAVTGMKDILPKEMEVRQRVLSTIRSVYTRFGFTEIETPIMEHLSNLLSKQGGDNEQLIFKVEKRGEKWKEALEKGDFDQLSDAGLRYDLTLPLSRFYAENQSALPSPFKALQIGPVFRADRPQKGRFREFWQCDIDVFGDASNLSEIDLIMAMGTVLKEIGFGEKYPFYIVLNDRRILKAMQAYAGFPEGAFQEVSIVLDKEDKIGRDGVKKELLSLSYTEEQIGKYEECLSLVKGEKEDILREGDIVNVDMTLSVNNYFGDASRMFIVGGKTTPEKEQLVRVAKECLEIGAEAAKAYCFVGDIGHAIQKHAEKYHYGVVRDLCGHGVGLAMHEEPEILHYGHKGTGMLLVPGMVFTIEPMINMGTWKVFIDADDPYGWEVISGDEKPSAQWEHTFLMTETGVEVLSY